MTGSYRLFVALGSAALGLATPAFAVPREAPPAPAPAATTVAPATKAKPQLYCIIGEVTGSRMRRKACHTRSEWLAQGFDPLTEK